MILVSAWVSAWSRRDVVRAGAALLVGLSACAPLRAVRAEEGNARRASAEVRLRRALRETFGGPSRFDPPAAPLPARSLPFGAQAAVRKLTSTIGPARIESLASDPDALRAHLAERQAADWQAGRTEWVDGWLLTQTEIAVLALVATGGKSA